MLKSSCIRSMFSSEESYTGLVILDYREIKQRFSATDMLDDNCTSETGIMFDGRTNGHTDRRWENISPSY